MTKADLVNQIVEETGLDKLEALTAVESFMNSIKVHYLRDKMYI